MQDRKTLITIVILLVICLPLATIGTVKHFKEANKDVVNNNINKDLIYNNKVYLYQDGELLKTYDCANCFKAKTIINDDEYHTNSYKSGTKILDAVINDMWAVFGKDKDIVLYNILGNSIATTYDEIKTYNVEHTEDMIVFKKNNKWGITYFTSAIKNDYDYIAFPAHFINDTLDTSMFIGKINNLWYILKSDGTALMPEVHTEIVDFNDNYYITYDGTYHIMDYNNVEQLANVSKDKVYCIDKYLFLVLNEKMYVYENVNESLKKTIDIKEYKEIYLSKNNDEIVIMLDGNLLETIALN